MLLKGGGTDVFAVVAKGREKGWGAVHVLQEQPWDLALFPYLLFFQKEEKKSLTSSGECSHVVSVTAGNEVQGCNGWGQNLTGV